MTIRFIRTFGIAFWALFIFTKAINIKPPKKIIISQAVFSLAISALITLFYTVLFPIQPFIIILSSCLFNKRLSEIKFRTVITTTVTACGIGYAINALSISLCIFAMGVVVGFNDSNDFYAIISNTCSLVVMGVSVLWLFKIRRFKNGFTFLHDRYVNTIGVLIAIVISFYYTVIIVTAVLSEHLFRTSLYALILSIAFCLSLVIVWWRTGITKTYRDYLVLQEKEDLKKTISEKDERIEEITKSNEYLSRIIHNDNKLLPSLEHAMQELCEDYSPEKAAAVLGELRRVSTERKCILYQYKKETKKLPSTNVTSLDITLSYMMKKAYENNIEFDVIVNGDVGHMIENLIKEEQLRTITADLLENAIIASKACDVRKILFTIGACDDSYSLMVEDSGVNFQKRTLRELGRKRTTTHKNEGGSGIGMMEVFSVMEDTGASLIINRLGKKNSRGYTKQVILRFDGEKNYIAD